MLSFLVGERVERERENQVADALGLGSDPNAANGSAPLDIFMPCPQDLGERSADARRKAETP